MTLDFISKIKNPAASVDDVYKRFQQWIVPSEYLYLYNKGGKVWVPHRTEVWECAEIIEPYDGKRLKVLTESGQEKIINTDNYSELPPLKNPDILIGENDLTSLSYLHEPAVLYNLLVRFVHRSSIYTYCGIVLVAINPYEELPIYGNDTIWAYRGRALGELEPHIFAIAEEAFTRMESEKKNQSIIVSGESGAGKTVSAKYVMRYFATVSGSSKETQVEKKVLASSPIMEAFGNAKTTRNDNSSRFGKFIELHFNRHYQIVGASMRTYLLEKSRVIFQSPLERNYHIFYQLCSSRSSFPELKLEDAQCYDYLSAECFIPGIDDEKTFEDTTSAMRILGFSSTDQMDIFHILAAILHLGNVQIMEACRQDTDSSYISEDDAHLICVAELLDIMKNELRLWLCHRKITSMKETFDKPMSVAEASFARDALAKHMYAKLFSWIVTKINKMLETGVEKHRFIGVLDIYGFETFDINSFEQFCINYANEKLQQQFNLHVFKLDQEEYFKEDIEWKFIDFYDNQPCIDLIETRLGILDLLDEECKMPKGTDLSWCEKLYTKCSKFQHFAKPRFGTASFQVKHFADCVEYQVDGFLEKNRDTVIEEQLIVLGQSGNRLLKKLFGDENEKKLRSNQHAATIGHSGRLKVPSTHSYSTATLGPSSAKKLQQIQHKKTVGSQFRDSLNALMNTLNSTTPHYIRCVKPNDNKEPFQYNPQRAVQQLRACGVLETIRISAAGFPSRVMYVDFYNRYKILHKIDRRADVKTICSHLVNIFIKDEDKYKYGKTKIFFRAGQVAYLERLRADRLKACCILIQKTVRGYLIRNKYLCIRRATILLQRVSKGYLARRRAYHIRRNRAATTIQRYIRGWLKRRIYVGIKRSTLLIQSYGRGLLARKHYVNLKRNNAAIIIQRNVRRWFCQVQYRCSLRSIVICQSAIRRFLAKRKLKELKKEARSVEHMKKLNKGLENKIISLQQKIDELQKEIVPLKLAFQELLDLRIKLEELKNIESEFNKLKVILSDKEVEMKNLINTLEIERREKENILLEKQNKLSVYEKKLKDAEEQKENLVLNIEKLEADNTLMKRNMEEMIKAKIEQEKILLLREQDQNREAYQKLLGEKNFLESRVESLEKELLKHNHSSGGSTRGHERSLSNASTISIQDLSHTSPNSVPETTIPNDKIDIGLVLKLQQKLKTLQIERDKLSQRIDTTERSYHQFRHSEKVKDSIKIQELEIENEKLHKNLEQMRKAVSCSVSSNDNAANELMSQFHALESELVRKREECNQLRNVLHNSNEGLKNVAKANYSPDADFQSINEDGELILAFETQKKINRQLEEELQWEKMQRKQEQQELLDEINRLRNDNERQQQILSLNITNSPQSQSEAYLQYEITRLTGENLELRDQYELLYKEYLKIKNYLRSSINETQGKGEEQNNIASLNVEPPSLISTVSNLDLELPTVRKKDGFYKGMFAFTKADVSPILRTLLYELKPTTALQLLPGLPAYIIFMCIRHTDITNDEERVRDLLSTFIGMIRKSMKRNPKDLETSIMWLSNIVRLVNVLKQYGGDTAYQFDSTPTQISQCLQNFDLSEYHSVLTDIACMLYQNIIRVIEEQIQNLSLAAILEHEALPGISGSKQLTRSQSVTSAATTPVKDTPIELQKRLTNVFKSLCLHGVDFEVVVQVFKQLFYFICATALNNLLLRRELCHWSKGIQIRFNLSHLEQWARDQNVQTQETHVVDELLPIIQAAQLLQARKTEADVNQIFDMCSRMTSNQIIKLLNLYTPGDDYEERVSVSFIRKVQEKLQERAKADGQSHLLMDTKVIFPVRFGFNASDIKLENVEIPPALNLPMLRKL